MPLPGTHHITDLWIGNHFQIGLILKSDTNTPINLTGAVLIFRCVAKGPTGLLRKSTAETPEYWPGDNTTMTSGFKITNPAAGECLLVLKPEETRKLAGSGSVPYEIEIRRGGLQQTVLQGNIVAKGGVNDDV